MFGKMAADALGLSDVGAVIKPADYDKVDADDYIMHEDDEKIYFLIKSKADEYCFTNLGLVHVDGANAVSKKRMLRRANYVTNRISNVYLETAGTVDIDVEIKFTLGAEAYSIDVHKKHLEELKDLYKALLKIAEMQLENQMYLGYAEQSLDRSTNAIQHIAKTQIDLSGEFEKVNEYAFGWLKKTSDQYRVKDFGAVFERYINN